MKKNNMKISMNSCIAIIIFLCMFFLSIFGMHSIFPSIGKEKQANFVMELLKIFFSSLVSAGVAYYVSHIQLKNALHREEEKEKHINRNRLKLLIIEIADNEEVLGKIKQQDFPNDSGTLLKSQISRKVLDMYFDKLILDDSTLAKIIKYDKKISLFISSSAESMKLTFEGLAAEIDSLRSSLEEQIKI